MLTIILLTISNIFMTFAWYGHLRYQNVSLWKVTLVSWNIAFFEYCFQVPANRIGSHIFNAAQLKTIQEIITLAVFSGFSIWYRSRTSSGTRRWASSSSWWRHALSSKNDGLLSGRRKIPEGHRNRLPFRSRSREL